MGWIIGLVAAAAWLNHIFTCFNQGLWGFLVAGAISFQLGYCMASTLGSSEAK